MVVPAICRRKAMCSLSWLQQNQSLIICFNRDEQKTRSRAIPPQVVPTAMCNVIMPTDRDGGGTWLAVNQFGIFVGLLNLYLEQNSGPSNRAIRNTVAKNGSVTKDGLKISDEARMTSRDTQKRSRGLLVKELSGCSDLPGFVAILMAQNLMVYPSFELVFISKSDKFRFSWDGQNLVKGPLVPFSSSSSYQTKSVVAARKQKFEQLVMNVNETTEEKNREKNKEMLIHLHSEHSTEKNAASICMHRDDACTVSMSLIEINHSKITYQYWDGAPCESSSGTRQEMFLKTVNN